MIGDSAKTATEKHIEKLIKQKSISRDEAKFCQIDGHFEVDCRKKKSKSGSNKDKTTEDKDTKATKSVFFSKSSAPAPADSDSQDESYEPRTYVIKMIQSERNIDVC